MKPIRKIICLAFIAIAILSLFLPVATFHDDDSVEFAPYNSGGEPVQKNVRKRGDSRFYETDGEKQSSYVCHLKVGKDSEDPAAEMFDQLKYLTKSMQKKEPPVPRT